MSLLISVDQCAQQVEVQFLRLVALTADELVYNRLDGDGRKLREQREQSLPDVQRSCVSSGALKRSFPTQLMSSSGIGEGVKATKLAASSMLPVPVYFACSG